ncbi:hypothetical protein Psuf_082280 [Phytohabitans suffuscus]|uniref:Uncharacterized protein n=1 Tax=Phytohabitans suffuscus TaxID=624315 RepID=A0A6F8YXL9_9ACTN|nr:hypothetical protein [Phytohabitans suffuscus]BCB90915.1 hypothetical protein Psuf_082280 [Phytohabitans suffuscus]
MARDLVAELQRLHRAAGRPSYRRISTEIRRRNHMPDTVSHETVSAILRGDGLTRWSKVECVVRYLATMAVHRPDEDEEVRRFHALWLAAFDRVAPVAAAPAGPPRRRHPRRTRPSRPRSRRRAPASRPWARPRCATPASPAATTCWAWSGPGWWASPGGR